MKKIANFFLVGLFIMIVLTSLLGLTDDAFHKTGIWYKDVWGYVKYYVLWVLPYWWLIILIGSIIIGLICFCIKIVISKLRD